MTHAGRRRRPRAFARFAAAFLLAPALQLAPGTARGQVPPDARWRTLQTAHFRVNYAAGLDSLARHAGASAERAYAGLARYLAAPPGGRIDLVLADNVDYSNGATTPFPYSHVYLYARPPVGDPELALFPDWMDLLLDHELTHAFHMEQTGKVGRVIRTVFGRLPFGWPVFPVVGTPGWSLEGLAVYHESHLTGEGRLYGTYHDMVLRTAALEGAFWGVDRLTGESPIWPGGAAAYIYGGSFMDYLAQRFGTDVERRLVAATASQRIPSFRSVAARTAGEPWEALYRDWRDWLRGRYASVDAEVRARGVTATEILTDGGYYALYPRVSPDGRLVAFVAQEPKGTLHTAVYDVAAGRPRPVSRRNSLDPAAWLPDGRLLTTQLEFSDPYRIFSDAYVQGPQGGERRITRGARLEQLDARRTDGRAVAVRDSAGMTRLVTFIAATGTSAPLTPFDARFNWAFPRWSPDGTHIAAARWSRGGAWDIVVLDTTGDVVADVTDDLATDTGPAWSADGRWLFWSSDRSGIPNLFAARVADVAEAPGAGRNPRGASGAGARPPSRVLQVTNVLTGAFWPEPSPDGCWLYFSGYHGDGWHLERMPLDTASWRAPDGRVVPPPDTIGVFGPVPADTTAGGSTRYSALATLRPRFWLPVLYYQARGDFWGAGTAGVDAVGRHEYGIGAAYDFKHGHTAWSASYSFAGLGNPVLQLATGRSWDDFEATGAAGTFVGFRRDDDVSVSASLLRRRVRSAASLSAGADLTVRRRWLEDAPPGVRLRSPDDRLIGAFAGAGFATYRTPPYAISREDGIAASLTGVRRRDTGFGNALDAGYTQAAGTLAAYKAISGSGFAHHVLAARASGLWRGGPGAEPHDVGGVSGQSESLGLTTVGAASVFLPVRGYAPGARAGTRAWSASIEYRAPVALLGRGWGARPYYLDRVFGDVFADAGDGFCPASQAAALDARGYACSPASGRPLASTGAELVADARVLIPATVRFRAGVGFPLVQGGRPRGWLTLGSSF